MSKLGAISVDFDGTIVDAKFPEIGNPKEHAFEVLKELQAAGFELILWTCREDDNRGRQLLTKAVDFCRQNGLEFDYVNGPSINDFREDRSLQRKPHCICYIDDKNLGGFPGWLEVRRILLGK